MTTMPMVLEQTDAVPTDGNLHDDVTDLLTPEQRLWVVIHRASGPHGTYCDWVSRGEWNFHKKNCPNFDCLKEAFRRYLSDRA